MTGGARYLAADRGQLRWDLVDLESQIALDHRVRVVWSFVESLDLSALYAAIGSRQGGAGRPPADPRIFLALWLFATLEGVGSARHVARLCVRDAAYRWICGGVEMNHHSLSDFRFVHASVLDGLLTESLTALVAEGMVDITEVAIDGTKVRASAGKGSFSGPERLNRLEERMAVRVARLKEETEADPSGSERRRRAAQLRGAEDVARRATAARATLERLRAEKLERAKTHQTAEAKKGEPRVSVTDTEARMMRFSDGAVRAGYNIQLAVTPGTGFIVAAETTDRRNDAGLVQDMVSQVESRLGAAPERVLADTTYATRDDIVDLGQRDIDVYTPVPADKTEIKAENQRRREQRREQEADELKAWRARMASDEGAAIYQHRTWVETINGILKGRGLGVMTVRSKAKVACVVLLQVLAHNLWRAHCWRSHQAMAAAAGYA